MHLQVGSKVKVRAYKADGSCYRWWTGTVEAVEREEIVVTTSLGHWVHTPDGGGRSRWAIRATYWSDRWYSVLELYLPDDPEHPQAWALVEIYVNINSPVEIQDGALSFTDHELDVSRELPGQARIVDTASTTIASLALTRASLPTWRSTTMTSMRRWMPWRRPTSRKSGMQR